MNSNPEEVTAEQDVEEGPLTLRDLIEKALVDRMTAATHDAVRRRRTHRGKGRTGNGGHPSLLNLHRDLGRAKDLHWLDS